MTDTDKDTIARMKLKNCPITGKAPRLYQDDSSDYQAHWDWNIEVDLGGGKYLGMYGFQSAEDAISAWNTRTDSPELAALKAENERLREALEWYASCSVAGKATVTIGVVAHAIYENDDGQRAREALTNTAKGGE